MIRRDGKQWEIDHYARRAIGLLENHGFTVYINKQHITKIKITLEKDGYTYDTELPAGDHKINYKGVIRFLEDGFEMSKKIDGKG